MIEEPVGSKDSTDPAQSKRSVADSGQPDRQYLIDAEYCYNIAPATLRSSVSSSRCIEGHDIEECDEDGFRSPSKMVQNLIVRLQHQR